MLLIPWILATEKTLQELLYPPHTLGYEKSLIYSSLVNSFKTASLRKTGLDCSISFFMPILHLK